ncbi:MAG: vWA domain-containing protein, partial [Deltaproteobacteria bacterium]
MFSRNATFRKRDWTVLGLSIFVHVAALSAMTLVTIAGAPNSPLAGIESVFSDEARTPEEFTTALNTDTEIAESMNLVPGGAVVTGVEGAGGGGGTGGGGGGGGGFAVDQAKIDSGTGFQDPTVGLGLGDMSLPGLESLGRDLGSGQIAGEVGAVVEGYGPALDRMTQELVRLMRESKVLVVWLFDESESMKDDQEELKGRIHRVYEELKLFDEDVKADVLLSAVVSFGQEVHFMLPRKKPTDDVPAIMNAIDAIPIDKSGIENTCHAVGTVISEYRRQAVQGKRKLVVVVISDEAGDDGEQVEETLRQARSASAPIYFLGRESVFGNLYAYVRWVHPQTGGLHYLPIRRGPETPFAELLPFDGFRHRMDASLSGFGPYEQVRLCRDTGGIFFMLPNEEQNLNEADSRKYAALDLKEYTPDLAARRDYAERRDKSPFRRAIWETIVLLNPFDPKNKEMEIPIDNWYSVNPAEYAQPVAAALAR